MGQNKRETWLMPSIYRNALEMINVVHSVDILQTLEEIITNDYQAAWSRHERL